MDLTKRELGKTGMMVTPVTLGCWAAGGGPEWGDKLDDSVYLDMMASAAESGVNFFDSAFFYGLGHSEELLGKALHPIRDKVYISTKQVADGLTHEKARETVESALKRLNTDYIDLFLVHWPSPKVEIGETMEELEKLKEAGLIRAIGVSNYTLEHLKRAMKYGRVDVIQPCFSLFWRQPEKDILPYCIENGIGVMSYSSLAQGLLTGKFTADYEFGKTDQRPKIVPWYLPETFPKAIDAARRIGEIGKKYGKTTSQTALNWQLHQKGLTTALVGAKTRAQFAENMGAFGWDLSGADLKAVGDIGMEIAKLVDDWDTLFGKDHPALKLGPDNYKK